MNNNNISVLEKFQRRWRINQKGGIVARLARWRILHLLILQKLGVNHWARTPLFFGEKMWVLTGETTSKVILGLGYSESALTALMIHVLKPGMRFVDVGAHLGYEALLASFLVGESGRVVTFEPQPKIGQWTIRNLERFPQARIVASAVGDFNGVIEFSVMNILHSAFSGVDHQDGKSEQISVPVTTLALALTNSETPVDFIKCDVEGAEMFVLRGAAELIERDHPLIVLEAEMPSSAMLGPRIKEFADFLKPFGYEGFSFEFDGVLRIGRLGEIEVGHANVGFLPACRPELRSLLQS